MAGQITSIFVERNMSKEIDLQRKLDALCNEYEGNWSVNDPPSFTDYLDRIDDQFREELLLALLEVEIDLRISDGQSIDPQQYARFGDAAVEHAFKLLSNKDETAMPGRSSGPLVSSESMTPKQIGPYKLLQQIGEGGMGSVWMAEQEKPVRRRVALKLIRADMGSKEVVARFEAERQALAMMNHQNIAKVLDAGTTDDGNPYFVMELVKGIPITQFCDENKLSIKERLQLFTPVCKAIQHAHQKGIIHRDLKPSNVLVTLYDGDAVPKVIDFGLAKALEHTTKLTDKTMFTEFGKVVGTIQYMSPEQAEMNALDVDTRTDVYSLGVMLYELLTGSTPLDKETIGQNALFQILAIIKEKEPPRPSNRLSTATDTLPGISEQRKINPAKLQQILRGELDWVVMKALEKDRRRRYETANDLAQDIQRYLTDETVTARPPSTGYRISKFISKNRGLVGTVALVVVLLLFAVAGTSIGMYRAQLSEADALAAEQKANEEKQIANSERRRADQARDAAILAEKTASNQSQALLATLAEIIEQTELEQKNNQELFNGIEGLSNFPQVRSSDVKNILERIKQQRLSDQKALVEKAMESLRSVVRELSESTSKTLREIQLVNQTGNRMLQLAGPLDGQKKREVLKIAEELFVASLRDISNLNIETYAPSEIDNLRSIANRGVAFAYLGNDAVEQRKINLAIEHIDRFVSYQKRSLREKEIVFDSTNAIVEDLDLLAADLGRLGQSQFGIPLRMEGLWFCQSLINRELPRSQLQSLIDRCQVQADYLQKQKKPIEAIAHFQFVLDATRDLKKATATSKKTTVNAAEYIALNQLAKAHQQQNDFEKALSLRRASFQTAIALANEDGTYEHHKMLTDSISEIAKLLEKQQLQSELPTLYLRARKEIAGLISTKTEKEKIDPVMIDVFDAFVSLENQSVRFYEQQIGVLGTLLHSSCLTLDYYDAFEKFLDDAIDDQNLKRPEENSQRHAAINDLLNKIKTSCGKITDKDIIDNESLVQSNVFAKCCVAQSVIGNDNLELSQTFMEEAADIYQRLATSYPLFVEFTYRNFYCSLNAAILQAKNDRFDGALRQLDKTVEFLGSLNANEDIGFGQDNIALLHCHARMVRFIFLIDAGRNVEAIECLEHLNVKVKSIAARKPSDPELTIPNVRFELEKLAQAANYSGTDTVTLFANSVRKFSQKTVESRNEVNIISFRNLVSNIFIHIKTIKDREFANEYSNVDLNPAFRQVAYTLFYMGQPDHALEVLNRTLADEQLDSMVIREVLENIKHDKAALVEIVKCFEKQIASGTNKNLNRYLVDLYNAVIANLVMSNGSDAELAFYLEKKLNALKDKIKYNSENGLSNESNLRELADTHFDFGQIEIRRQNYANAQKHFEEAVRTLELDEVGYNQIESTVVVRDNYIQLFMLEMVRAWSLYAQFKDHGELEKILQQGEAYSVAVKDKNQYVQSLIGLAGILAEFDDRNIAIRVARQARDVCQKHTLNFGPFSGRDWLVLGQHFDWIKELDEKDRTDEIVTLGEILYGTYLDHVERQLSSESDLNRDQIFLMYFCVSSERMHNIAEVRPVLKKQYQDLTRKLIERIESSDLSNRANYVVFTARLYEQIGEFESAEQLFLKLFDESAELDALTEYQKTFAFQGLIELYEKTQAIEKLEVIRKKFESFLMELLEGADQTQEAGELGLGPIHFNLGELYEGWGNPDEAKKWKQKYSTIRSGRDPKVKPIENISSMLPILSKNLTTYHDNRLVNRSKVISAIWRKVIESEPNGGSYVRELRQLKALNELGKPDSEFLATQAFTEYRAGNYEQAIKVASDSKKYRPKTVINMDGKTWETPTPHPIDHAIIALCQLKLGNKSEAGKNRKEFERLVNEESFRFITRDELEAVKSLEREVKAVFETTDFRDN